jgi:23S rRNA (cytosine1962-C5)-methyltransferase
MPKTPRTSDPELRVEVDPRAAAAVLHGHPWVWRTSVRKAPAGLSCGTPVVVFSRDDGFVGRGLWDPESPIALRIYGTDPSGELDLAFLASAVARAIELRDRMFPDATTSAYRLCNGEGDRVPGVVIDRYGSVAVAKFDGNAIRPWGLSLLEAVWPHLHSRAIRSLAVRGPPEAANKLTTVAGENPSDSIEVLEHGMRMVVDLAQGQKTGAFLDQRENRRRVRARSRECRVLNLYSYAGGFSCAAALGGATHVTSVDIAHGAHVAAQRSFRLNGLDPAAHTFVTSDVPSFLQQAADRNERYDLIISDPPSFAPSEKTLPRALSAYRRLHQACAKLLAHGGTLCASSCSSHVDIHAFMSTLDDSAVGNRCFVVVGSYGQPCDHPTTPAFAEGRYLKFVILKHAPVALAR